MLKRFKTSNKIHSNKIDYNYYPPKGEGKSVAIILLGGSNGGIPDYLYDPEVYTNYPVMALGYFKTKNTPKYQKMIPLEYFDEAIEAFKSMDEVKSKKIVVIGDSKGGELALLLAANNPKVNGVISRVPSSVVFQGIGGVLKKSSWSLGKKQIPYVPYPKYDYSSVKDGNWVDMYNKALSQNIDMEEVSIKVENIRGSILLLSGEDDIVWPTTRMCEDMINRLEKRGFNYSFEHIAYKDAGHALNNSWDSGGTVEGNDYALKHSRIKVTEFLEKLDNM